MGTTSNRALRYPAGSSTIQVPADIKALADDVDAQLGVDTGWLDLVSLVSGWAVPSGNVAQVRRIGKHVEGRGFLQNSTFTGGLTTCAALPSGIPAPPTVVAVAVGGATAASRAWQVSTNSTVQAYTSSASGAFWSLWDIRYAID